MHPSVSSAHSQEGQNMLLLSLLIIVFVSFSYNQLKLLKERNRGGPAV